MAVQSSSDREREMVKLGVREGGVAAASRQKQTRTFKRHMSSGEDMLRKGLHTMMATSPPDSDTIDDDAEAGGSPKGDAPPSPSSHPSDYASWRLPDRIGEPAHPGARPTPKWLALSHAIARILRKPGLGGSRVVWRSPDHLSTCVHCCPDPLSV